MSSTTEPYDVVEALRTLRFAEKGDCVAWLNTPNPDLDGLMPSMAMVRGQYDDVLRAIVLEAGRRNVARYHPQLAEGAE